MSVDKKVPEIRFKGFSGEWENKKIGIVLTEIKRPIELMDNTSYQLVTVKRRNEGVVPRAVLKGKNILVKNYFSVEAGDYLISKRQVVHGANGIVPDNLDGAVVSNEYLVVTDSDDITARYWTTISIRPEMYKLFFVSSYGVDIEKLVFDVTDWKNRTIVIPQVTEQKNITDYFQKLDTLINQHQQKHDKLSRIKKSMLEKMFPKQGETIPEIRFKGFSREWDKYPTSTFISSLDAGVSVNSGDRPANENELGILKTSCVTNGFFEPNENKVVFKKHETSRLKEPVLENTIIISRMNTPTLVGANAYVSRGYANYFLPDRLWAAKPTSIGDLKFIAYILGSDKGRLALSDLATGTSGSMKNISKLAVLRLELRAPEKKEQAQIGNYLQKLDSLIKQHQQQITKLNNIKQACLSKMFV